MSSKKFRKLSAKWRIFRLLGPRRWLQYLFFQRILGINGNVPWPVHWASVVLHSENIEVAGLRPFVGYLPGMYVQAINGIKIGKNVRIGPGVKIISANHDVNDYSRHDKTKPITIGDNCWIAADAIILPGVSLGCHVVVAAGAVVSKSFSDNCLIGGVPAKILKILPEYAG